MAKEKQKSIQIACEGAGVLKVDDLVPMQGAFKTLSEEAYLRLRNSIIELGFSFPVQAWKSGGKNYIIDAHQRVATVKRMRDEEGFKLPSLPVSWVKAASKKEAAKKLLAAASQYGHVTDDGLFEFMKTFDISMTELTSGFQFPELDFSEFQMKHFPQEISVAGHTRVGKTGVDEDDIPEKPEARTQPGDMYLLGEHKLLCGDSTDEKQVARLMGEELADLVFTDPPYGVNYDGGHADADVRREKLANDDSVAIYNGSIPMMSKFSKPKSALYLWFASTKSLPILQALQDNKYEVRCWIIWNKNMAQFGAIGAQYKQKHEPCLYLYKKGQSPFWDGPNNEVSVWDVSRASKNEYHPTQKPVELAERAIKNSCPTSGVILDLFGGSGSTMIAAEKSDRAARLMELSPDYCDVIVERWEKYTGKKAKLISPKTVKTLKPEKRLQI